MSNSWTGNNGDGFEVGRGTAVAYGVRELSFEEINDVSGGWRGTVVKWFISGAAWETFTGTLSYVAENFDGSGSVPYFSDNTRIGFGDASITINGTSG